MSIQGKHTIIKTYHLNQSLHQGRIFQVYSLQRFFIPLSTQYLSDLVSKLSPHSREWMGEYLCTLGKLEFSIQNNCPLFGIYLLFNLLYHYELIDIIFLSLIIHTKRLILFTKLFQIFTQETVLGWFLLFVLFVLLPPNFSGEREALYFW